MEAALAVGISITVIMLCALFFDRFRLPNILGFLIAGILIGQNSPLYGFELFGFQFKNLIISDQSIINVFAVLGSALILFGIGLEFSFARIIQVGLFTFIAGFVKFFSIFTIFYIFLTLFGLNSQTAIILSVAFSFSSTPIIIKILEESGKIRRSEVGLIIPILIMEDLIAIFFLGILSMHESSMYGVLISIIRISLTLLFSYVILSKLVHKFLQFVSHSEDLLLLSTVSLVLLIGYVLEWVGLSFSIGAFLAGSIIATSVQSKKIEEKIKPFNFLFSAFFFFSIGLLVSAAEIFSNLALLVVLLLFSILARFFSSFIAAYFVGYDGRNSSFFATAMLPLSEISLIIINYGWLHELIPSSFIGIFSFAIILSSFVSVLLISRENEIYSFLNNILPAILIKNAKVARTTILNMRKSFSTSIKYHTIVEKLPTITYDSHSLSTREQITLNSKNSIIFFFLSSIFYILLFLSQFVEGKIFSDLFIFIFIGFLFFGSFFIITLETTLSLLIKVFFHSQYKEKYYILLYLLEAILFLMLAVLFYIAFQLTPISFSILLSFVCLFFFLIYLYKAKKSLKIGF